jgi:cytochrome c553
MRSVDSPVLAPGPRRSVLRRGAGPSVAALLLAFCWGGGAQAAGGNAEAGRKIAETCFSCHGETGISQLEGIPSLAGQADNFMQWQLVFFRSGRRKNELMQPMAASLSDADIKNLGAFFSSLTPPKRPPDAADVSASDDPGKVLSTQRRCDSCHGEKFTGIQAAPRLAWQREEYLAKALTDYKTGARPSSAGAVMNEVAAGLSDSDIKSLAHYLANLP